jgi:hypothetical protein
MEIPEKNKMTFLILINHILYHIFQWNVQEFNLKKLLPSAKCGQSVSNCM